MPARRRIDRRRASADAAVWDMYLLSGHDYFDVLLDAGIVREHGARPSDEEAQEAWRRYGAVLLEQWEAARHPKDTPTEPWALQMFGAPSGRRRPLA